MLRGVEMEWGVEAVVRGVRRTALLDGLGLGVCGDGTRGCQVG